MARIATIENSVTRIGTFSTQHSGKVERVEIVSGVEMKSWTAVVSKGKGPTRKRQLIPTNGEAEAVSTKQDILGKKRF